MIAAEGKIILVPIILLALVTTGSSVYSEIGGGGLRGMNITIVTTAQTDNEGYELLRSLGMPIKEKRTKEEVQAEEAAAAIEEAQAEEAASVIGETPNEETAPTTKKDEDIS